MKNSLLIIMIVCLFVACSQQNSEEQNKQTSTTTEKKDVGADYGGRGELIVQQLQQVLSAKLQSAIRDSGIAYAINYCNIHAYPLTDSISKIHGVEIKRATTKTRNPQNLAKNEDMIFVKRYSEAVEKGEGMMPALISSPKSFIYYSPILIHSPSCLKCHGEPEKDIAAQDYILLRMLYPDDKATGYKMNDLRGVWRVDFPKTAL